MFHVHRSAENMRLISKPMLLAAVAMFGVVFASSGIAARVENRVAVFSGIDKITGRIKSFDVYIDETVQFGQLQITPRVCYSRGASEQPKTSTFVQVDEITLDSRIRRIFSGWMFAESPGLNAIEHPVNDIWLIGCKQTSDETPPPRN